jgi:hypothetical protein
MSIINGAWRYQDMSHIASSDINHLHGEYIRLFSIFRTLDSSPGSGSVGEGAGPTIADLSRSNSPHPRRDSTGRFFTREVDPDASVKS